MRSAQAPQQANRRDAGGHRLLATAVATAALAALLAACGPVSRATPGTPVGTRDTSTVTYALQPTAQATYIFPFMGAISHGGDFSIYNVNDFQYLMYRPLYWFGTGVNP
ncbi:MAG: hypothetical protein J2P28_08300, partial [Actinobacteria bacterium]|nr:hypothetical protein [Actinomycetota bacterium]